MSLILETAYSAGDGDGVDTAEDVEGVDGLEDEGMVEVGKENGETATRSSDASGARCIREVRTGIWARMVSRIRDANSSV